jgi:cbb3-type cytochrome oxidase subunit 3
MSFDVDLIGWSKLVSLAIFAPIYVGACIYAYWKPNRARFERLSELPLLED